jgi:hypothetical protein
MSTRDFGLYSSGRKSSKLSILKENKSDLFVVFLDRLSLVCILLFAGSTRWLNFGEDFDNIEKLRVEKVCLEFCFFHL